MQESKLGGLWQDLAGAGRRARRRPRTAVAFILSVAIALGGIVGVFDVAYAIAHRPLAFNHPGRIAVAEMKTAGMIVSLYDWRENPRASEVFSQVAEYHLEPDFLTSGGPQAVVLAQVTPGFFELLGIRMALGHGLPPNFVPNAAVLPAQPMVISHRLWISRFGGDPGVIGREVSDERVYPYHFRIVGVAPQEASFPSGADGWVCESSMVMGNVVQSSGAPIWEHVVVARLKPGISFGAAEAAIRSWPRNQRYWVWNGTSALKSLPEVVEGAVYRLSPQLWLLSLLLLITAVAAALSICSHEFEARREELRVRQYLGASPARLLRYLCLEICAALVLTVPPATLIGAATAGMMARYFSAPVRLTTEMAVVDLALAAGALGLIAVLAGLRYARGLGLLRLRPGPRVAQPGPHGSGRMGLFRPRLQAVAATALLALAALLVQGAYSLGHLDPGVRANGVSIATLDLPFDLMRSLLEATRAEGKDGVVLQQAADRAINDFHRRTAQDVIQIQQRVRSYPEVASVGVMTLAPFNAKLVIAHSMIISPEPVAPGSSLPAQPWVMAHPVGLSAGTLRVLGIPLLYGRYLTAGDQSATVINLDLADRFGPGAQALGQYVEEPESDYTQWARIVGIVRNTRQHDLLAPAVPTAYFPLSGVVAPQVDLIVRIRAGLSAANLRARIQDSAEQVVAGSAVLKLAPMSELIRSFSQPLRRTAVFLLALALPGLGMAGICAWGQADSELRRRRREAGVRLALGARPARLAFAMLRRELAYTLGAAGLGACVAWWLSSVVVLQFPGAGVHPPVIVVSAAVMVALELLVAMPTVLGWLRRPPGELIDDFGG